MSGRYFTLAPNPLDRIVMRAVLGEPTGKGQSRPGEVGHELTPRSHLNVSDATKTKEG
jgi:hypothetical protein